MTANNIDNGYTYEDYDDYNESTGLTDGESDTKQELIDDIIIDSYLEE
jgi:hypothetical protein